MNYPLISQYVEAICDAENSLDKLRHLKPVMDKYGSPTRSSGAFAVVFKMEDPGAGKLYALKCFTEEQRGRAEAYRAISDELQYARERYFTSMRYYEDELFVDTDSNDTTFPVLLMDWIEGETMESYIAQHYNDTYSMSCLTYEFCKMASWLRSQPFAHGDIKPDNIIVRADGTLTLIDYDGMFVPSMKGQKSPTLGTADFRHPERTVDDFDETIDDFTLASMALSLKAISLKPELAAKYGTTDKLLFSEGDYKDLRNSSVMRELLDIIADKEISRLYSFFLMAYSEKNLSAVSFRKFLIEKPEEEILSTEVTDEDLADCVVDEYGVKYSKDWKRLLWAPNEIKNYFVHEGTKVICDGTFYSKYDLKSITIPDSVMTIGDKTFYRCSSLESIILPNSVTTIGDEAFDSCRSLKSITIPDRVTTIRDRVFSSCSALKSITIPDSVTTIGDSAFSWCSSLESITLPNSVTTIGKNALYECKSLKFIIIPDSITTIGSGAFGNCSSLESITIPDSVITIRDSAFSWCSSLESITLSNNIKTIGDSVFSWCLSLKSITIPNTVTTIGKNTFYECKSLKSIIIADSVTTIGDSAFSGCSSLESITLPNSITTIGDRAFNRCSSLKSITISDSVTTIGKKTFYECKSLKSIIIADSVTTIGDSAFSGCSSLESITLPNSITTIGSGAFNNCSSLESITIPESVTTVGYAALGECNSLNEEIKKELLFRFSAKIFWTL